MTIERGSPTTKLDASTDLLESIDHATFIVGGIWGFKVSKIGGDTGEVLEALEIIFIVGGERSMHVVDRNGVVQQTELEEALDALRVGRRLDILGLRNSILDLELRDSGLRESFAMLLGPPFVRTFIIFWETPMLFN